MAFTKVICSMFLLCMTICDANAFNLVVGIVTRIGDSPYFEKHGVSIGYRMIYAFGFWQAIDRTKGGRAAGHSG